MSKNVANRHIICIFAPQNRNHKRNTLVENENHIERLCEAIETVASRKMHTPKDFDFLSQLLLERQGQHISASTLKRIWGYVNSDSMPRRSTLDVLAQFVGSKDWDDFCNNATPEPSPSPVRKRMGVVRTGLLGVVALIFIVAAFFVLPRLFRGNSGSSAYILHSGQTFATTDAYLQLFGIKDSENPWSQPLPHHTGIILWGPEYQHPNWHNEGNADSLMPTITEFWQPADTSEASLKVMVTRNADNYLRATSFRELRITFMKGLTDTTYTFLGIYRLDLNMSDSTRLVWQRIATECDLSNLSYLEQLRH